MKLSINERNKYKIDSDIRRLYIFRTATEDDEIVVRDIIHEQLVGNPDYINSRIILNDFNTREGVNHDGLFKNEVHLYIFMDSESDPDIIVPGVKVTEFLILNGDKIMVKDSVRGFKNVCIDCRHQLILLEYLLNHENITHENLVDRFSKIVKRYFESYYEHEKAITKMGNEYISKALEIGGTINGLLSTIKDKTIDQIRSSESIAHVITHIINLFEYIYS